MKLTKRVIDSLTYTRKSGAQCVWDDDLAGFGVRVYPTGRKSFVVAYRVEGRQRFHTLGKVGELTVHEARTQAMEVLSSVRRGADPSGDRIAYRQAPTMKDLSERYMRQHARPRKKPFGIANDERTWRKHVLPRLGKKKVADVTRADIFELHARMGEKTPIQANRTIALLSKAFNLCEIWGWRPDGSNPVRHVPRFPENKRERFLSEAELLRLAQALNEVERLQLEEPASIAAIRLILLTGCRSGETKGLRWSEVDFQRRCLRLADSKTGRKTIYLSSGALQVLSNIERMGVSYPALADRSAEVSGKLRERGELRPDLYLDVTGLGAPVVELFSARVRDAQVVAVYFTHGDRRNRIRHDQVQLGKAYLVARLQTLLQAGCLHLPRTADAEDLARDLPDFQIDVAEDANDRYGAFRVGPRDELVTALGLASQPKPPRSGVLPLR